MTIPDAALDRRPVTLAVSGTVASLRLGRTYGHFRLDANTAATVQGLAGYAVGRIVRVTCVGSGAVTLAHNAGGALSPERIAAPGGADIELATDESVALWWDPEAGAGDGRWRVLERSVSSGPVLTTGSSFPASPADYQLHWHTTYKNLWTHDPALGKWVGPTRPFGFGHRGTASGSGIYEGWGYPVHGGADRGHYLNDTDWRLLELRAAWTGTASGDLNIRRNNAATVASVSFGAADYAVDRDLAATFSSGGVMQVQHVLSLGTQANVTCDVVAAPLENVT